MESEEEQGASMSLMGGVAGGPPPAPVDGGSEKRSNKLLTQGTLLIVLVAVTAAGAIYAMRVTGTTIVATMQTKTAEAKVAQAIAKLAHPDRMAEDDPMRSENLDRLFNDPDRIVNMLANRVEDRQVPIEYVKKNPFLLTAGGKDEPEAVDTGNDDEHRRRKLEEQRRKQLENELKTLTLQTVVTGENPIAVINGEMLREGMAIGSFTIETITQKGAVLSADKFSFNLLMESEVEVEDNRLFNRQ